jgi:hypothetical protein
MNLTPGYFGADYWPVDYWDDNYWPDAGAAAPPVVAPTVGATRRRPIPAMGIPREELIMIEDEELMVWL